MKLRYIAGLAGAFVVGASVMAFAEGAARAATATPPETLRWLGLFGDALYTSQQQHLTPVDAPRAIQAALNGMLRSLDAHSSYIAPDDFKAMVATTRGETAGIGLTLMSDGLALAVSRVEPGSAADSAGARLGDYVIAIDGVETANDLDLASERLRGAVGTPVTLTVLRDGRQLSLSAARGPSPRLAAVPIARMEGDVGYISLVRMTETATTEVRDAVERLKSQNPAMKGVVLDLRDDAGGLLDQTVGVAETFLSGGEILTQRGRDSRDAERYDSRGPDRLGGLPMVVMVNGQTASGAEIVAGSLQARGRAKIVGVPTYGSGTIQTVIPLRRGEAGAIKITTGVITLPAGRLLQKVGVTPDVAVARDAAEAEAAAGVRFRPREASLPGAIDLGVSQPAPTRPAVPPPGFVGDYQLARAVSLARGG